MQSIEVCKAGVIWHGKVVEGKGFIEGRCCVFRSNAYNGSLKLPVEFAIIDAANRGGIHAMYLGETNGKKHYLYMGCTFGLAAYCKDQLA